jgi:hypothetical protein
VSERKMSALNERSALGERYSTVTWAITFGFATALIIAGVLYYSFNDKLILKRSIAITPPPVAAPVAVPLVPIVPQTK